MPMANEEFELGTDTSKWGEEIDADKMAANARFTILKAGQGSWFDPYFEINRADEKGKLPRGAYWYYDSRYKPSDQARLFVEALGDDLMECPLWCDYEEKYGGPYSNWLDFYNFVRILGELLPDKEIGIYTGYYYWLDHVPEEAHKYFKDYPLWLAWYTDDLEYILVPQPWEELDLWQFSESGDAEKFGIDPSVKKAIDLDYYTGIDFNSFTSGFYEDGGGGGAPQVTTIHGRVISPTGVNIRKRPNISGVKIGASWIDSELNGSKIISDKNGNSWMKLKNVYVAVEYDGQTLVEIDDTSPTPPLDEGFFYVPKDGKTYWQTAHDYQNPYWGYRPRSGSKQDGNENSLDYRKDPPDNALPETIATAKNSGNDFIPLSEEWQWFWYEMLVKQSDGYMTSSELMTAWKSLVAESRALTDRHSAAYGYIDYVSGENLDDPLGKGDIQIKLLSMGGNLVEQISRNGNLITVKAFNPLLPPPRLDDVWGDCSIIHQATQETMEQLADGTWKVVPFPQIRKNGIKTGTLFPFCGYGGTNTMEKFGTKCGLAVLDNGEKFTPYNLRRNQ